MKMIIQLSNIWTYCRVRLLYTNSEIVHIKTLWCYEILITMSLSFTEKQKKSYYRYL